MISTDGCRDGGPDHAQGTCFDLEHCRCRYEGFTICMQQVLSRNRLQVDEAGAQYLHCRMADMPTPENLWQEGQQPRPGQAAIDNADVKAAVLRVGIRGDAQPPTIRTGIGDGSKEDLPLQGAEISAETYPWGHVGTQVA